MVATYSIAARTMIDAAAAAGDTPAFWNAEVIEHRTSLPTSR